jgi:hypothetical protein
MHVNIAILFFQQIQKVNLQQVLHVETLVMQLLDLPEPEIFTHTVPHIRIYNIPGV